MSKEPNEIKESWPHAPVHRLSEKGACIVTAGTYRKEHFFNTPEKLSFLRNLLLKKASEYDWNLQAWAIMSNHYHFVAVDNSNTQSLHKFVSDVHRISSTELNKLDSSPGRKVWFQYWDTFIRNQKSYMTRLKYVHFNPLKHGLARVAEDYEWSSASWFYKTAEKSFKKTVESFKIDRVNVIDDF